MNFHSYYFKILKRFWKPLHGLSKETLGDIDQSTCQINSMFSSCTNCIYSNSTQILTRQSLLEAYTTVSLMSSSAPFTVRVEEWVVRK